MKKSLISLAVLQAAAVQAQIAVGDEVAIKVIDLSPKDKQSENDDALTLANAGHSTKPGNDEYLKPIVTREMLASDRRAIHIGQAEEQTTEIQSFYIGRFGAKHHVAGAHAAALA